MLILVILITLMQGYKGSLCGQPQLCHCNMGLLACLNNTLETLPDFTDYEKTNTMHLDIANTQMKTLPRFGVDEWPHLKMVDIRSNTDFDICHLLKQIFPQDDLTLLSDCTIANMSDSTLPQLKGHHQNPIWIFCTLCIVFLELMALVIYLFKRKIYRPQYADYQKKTDLEFLKDTITTHTVHQGSESAQLWGNNFIATLRADGDAVEIEELHSTLMKSIEEAQVFPNRVYIEDPWICPYCPECADEAGDDVVDYPYRRSPYCEKHNPKPTPVRI